MLTFMELRVTGRHRPNAFNARRTDPLQGVCVPPNTLLKHGPIRAGARTHTPPQPQSMSWRRRLARVPAAQ